MKKVQIGGREIIQEVLEIILARNDKCPRYISDRETREEVLDRGDIRKEGSVRLGDSLDVRN